MPLRRGRVESGGACVERLSSAAVSERVAFLGLGVMGRPMAAHLYRAGHSVTVYNRTREKAARFVAEVGGRAAPTPAEAAREARLVFCCVGNDDDVRAVILGAEGVLGALARGAVIVDHTTTSAVVARELSQAAAAREVSFLDAPVSGGQKGAEDGTLTVMAGGDPDAFTLARPFLAAYARAAQLLGPSGSGQLAKMVNQICIAGLLEGLAEALDFARAAGLDARAVVDVISKGAARSWQMENRAESMLAGRFDFGFAVDWMRKDLGIALDEARRNGASLPVTALVDQLYAEVQAQGGGRWDTSSLIARLAKLRER
jgi:3-hydroxyisobutyrate dehydrogenase